MPIIKNMKKTLIIYSILSIAITASCTKEIDDDIFGGTDVEELILDPENPEIDPITGEPIENPDDEGNPDEEEEENPEEEEVDPNLSADNSIDSWQIFNGNTLLTPSDSVDGGDDTFKLLFLAGTNITNITIQFSLPANATVAQSTTGLNFTTNDGVKVFDVVAENGEIRTYAFDISIEE